jgi:cytochrome c oxidase subunit 2
LNQPGQSILDPHGPGAARLLELGWVLIYGTLVPAVLTLLLLLYVTLRRRAKDPTPETRTYRDHAFVLGTGGVLTAIIVVALFLANVRMGAEAAKPPAEPAFTVDIIGHQFWWEIHYPDHDVVTANELHIPTGVPIRIRTASADVIHSFWVPQLHGKIDMTPGKTKVFWIQADDAGVYRGQCTEFCGIQHALMAFLTVAETPEAFERWIAHHRQPATQPDDPELARGFEVYREAACGHCHAIRGLVPESATGVVGPDLTHFAGRATIGAATLANNRGNLAGWVIDPHTLKPGVRMPPATLPPDDLHALVAFLESLR